MLPAHIIDSIREREARRHDERPQPTIEMPQMPKARMPVAEETEEKDRGVWIIEL